MNGDYTMFLVSFSVNIDTISNFKTIFKNFSVWAYVL